MDKDEVRKLIDIATSIAYDYHQLSLLNQRMWRTEGPHTGVTWRACKAQRCKDFKAKIIEYEIYATPRNHNPYALRNYHKKI